MINNYYPNLFGSASLHEADGHGKEAAFAALSKGCFPNTSALARPCLSLARREWFLSFVKWKEDTWEKRGRRIRSMCPLRIRAVLGKSAYEQEIETGPVRSVPARVCFGKSVYSEAGEAPQVMLTCSKVGEQLP